MFPPYESPRTKPAVSVIFAEDPEIMLLNDDVTLMRTKRAVAKHMKKYMKKNYRRPSVFSGVWHFLLGKVRTTGKVIKRVKDEAMCAKTRLKVVKMKLKNYYYKKKKKEREEFYKIRNQNNFNGSYAVYGDQNSLSRSRRQARGERMMNSMDDCFSDMPEPKYGFRTKVTIVENSPCVFGSTCGNGFSSKRRKRRSE